MSENTKSLKIKIIAAVSVFLFVVAVTVSVIIGGNYRILANQYEDMLKEQQQLELDIYNKNTAYYNDMLLNGFCNIAGGKTAVYDAIKKFYGYRLRVDGQILKNSTYGLQKDYCTITIEEYYSTNATNYLSVNVLNYFKYLNNPNGGGEKTPDETIYEDILQGSMVTDFNITINGCEWDITRKDEGSTTKIVITVTGMSAGTSSIMIGLSTDFMTKFNVDNRTIEVITVI